MAGDLIEIHGRLDFIDAETTAIHVDADAFIQGGGAETRWIRRGPDALKQVRHVQPVPLGLQIRTGWVIHEACACLDSLVCQMALRAHPEQQDNPSWLRSFYFPMAMIEEKHRRALPMLGKLSDDERAKIISLAPYTTRDEVLYAFHEFDNMRKHRRLSVTAASVRQVHVTPLSAGLPDSYEFERLWPSERKGQTSTAAIAASAAVPMESSPGPKVTFPADQLSKEWTTLVTVPADLSWRVAVGLSITFQEPGPLFDQSITDCARALVKEVRRIVSAFD